MIQTWNNNQVSAILPMLVLEVYILTTKKMNSLYNQWIQVSILNLSQYSTLKAKDDTLPTVREDTKLKG